MSDNKKEFDLTDLCRAVSERIVDNDQDGPAKRYTETEVRGVLAAAFVSIAEALWDPAHRVELHHVGVFALQPREADNGALPNGDTWSTPDRLKIVFRPAPAFMASVSVGVDLPVY